MSRREEALSLMDRALALSARVSAESPEVPDFAHQIADWHDILARFYWEAGRYVEAIQARHKALAQHVMLESKHPERDYEKHIAQYQRFLAMMFARCPDVRVRDPAAAVRLAQAVVDILPSGGNSWCVLGEALYRDDKWDGAVEALERSLTLDDHRTASRAWILLAMANWRRGRQEEAHCCYEKALGASGKPQSLDNQPHQFKHGVDHRLDLFVRPEGAVTELTQLQTEAQLLLSSDDRRGATATKEEDPTRKSNP
jgi:tetratricopeptide (TPR) repeat protein